MAAAVAVMIMNLATLVDDRSRMREATARLSTEVRRARDAVPKPCAKHCINRLILNLVLEGADIHILSQ